MTVTAWAVTSEPTTAPVSTSPPAREAIIAAATSHAWAMVAWLMPFSKRAEDSLRKLNCFDVRRTDNASNKAASSAIVVVSSVTSESNPPITPAKATGTCPFVITVFSGVNCLFSPSNVTNSSAAFARRTTIS